jgi:hypothetical protein
MRTLAFTVLLMAAFAGGCDISAAKFVAPSSGSVELASHNGFLWTVPGNAVLDDGTMGPQQNLLYILVVCPDMAANGKGTQTKYGARVNTYISHWETLAGRVAVSVAWNRRDDKVTIGTNTFARAKGNVFVVKREPTGALVSFQFPAIGRNVSPDKALDFIQHQMSNDAVVAAVRLPQRD